MADSIKILAEHHTLTTGDLNIWLQDLVNNGWTVISVQCINSDGALLNHVCYNWLVVMSRKER